MSKPLIRTVQSERAARVGADTAVSHEWPVTTATLIADALKAFEKGDPTAMNSKVYSLIRLKILLQHAQIQMGVVLREFPEDEKIQARIKAMKASLSKLQEDTPIKVVS